MKVSREQATENRSRIVDVAGRLFRQRGFDGIGVADLMKAAGLTHGGFYGHFKSKDDLAVEACDGLSRRSADAWMEHADRNADAALPALLDRYLSAAHRNKPEDGCVFAALATDVARQGNPALRRTFTEGLRPLIDVLARAVPGRSKAAKRERALASMSGMVGALILSRAVDDSAFSDEILAAARHAFAGSAES